MNGSRQQSLGGKLASLLGSGFFRPLSRPSAAVYIDCAERLVHASDEGGLVVYKEARALIGEVLVSHPDIHLDEDEGGLFRNLDQRASQFFNKLIEAHWIDPRRTSLDEHYILVTPSLRRLLRLLQDLGETRPAELKDFAATLRSLCNDLLRPDALDPNRLSPEEMRQTVKDLCDRAARAEEQMHAVETLILQQEEAQRTSESPQETLRRFLVEFHAGEHMVCYDALQEAGLLPRLTQACMTVQEAYFDPFAKQRLAEGIAKHLSVDLQMAYIEAESWFLRLQKLLASIPKKQRAIDGRMADFARISNSRHRYQTEMRGRRPEQVKAYMDAASLLYGGKSFATLTNEPGMNLLTPKIEILFGADSLARSPRQKTQMNLALPDSMNEGSAEAANDDIRRHNINSLTPQRAVRMIEKYLPEKGGEISTETIHLSTEDDLLDLFAVLAFDRGNSSSLSRTVRWRIHPARADFGTEPVRIPLDTQADRQIERFTIERIS